MSEPRHRPHSTDGLPRARIEKNWQTRLFWLAPIGAAALAGWFIYSEVFRTGPTLHILFDDAQGLQPGKSQMEYRGAQIGTVKDIKLTPDQHHVDVTVSLTGPAKNVAREGSRFWIVRAQLSVEQIEAPQTLVSGNYITVDPGNGKPQTGFIGLPESPILEPPGDLNIVLITEKLGSVKKRTPVFYRGIQVGEVRQYDLGPASQTVSITLQIRKDFAPLVRMNSMFWNAGGLDVSIGLRGADISAQSAQTLISGGIAFATPDTAQQQALPGTSFRLYDKPEDTWLTWSPAIKLDRHTAAPQETAKRTLR